MVSPSKNSFFADFLGDERVLEGNSHMHKHIRIPCDTHANIHKIVFSGANLFLFTFPSVLVSELSGASLFMLESTAACREHNPRIIDAIT